MVKINKICSIQGSSVENEDAVGSQNQYFWIIDGATDLYNSKEEIGYSVFRSCTYFIRKFVG